MNYQDIVPTLGPLWPIMFVLGGALLATILGFYVPRKTVTWIGIGSLLLSLFSMVTLWGKNERTFQTGAVTLSGGNQMPLFSLLGDNIAILMGTIIIIGSIIALLVSLDTAARARVAFPEFDAMLLYAVTGTLLMAFSGDLIVMLIGLEVMSLAGYVLTMMQDSRRAEESALKYFLLGSAGSAILIYGIAFLYGATGSLNYAAIAERVTTVNPTNAAMLVAGGLLVLIGFGFKIALAPFHQWTPDVYSGAPTAVSLFLSTVIKVAAFAGMLRVFGGALQNAPGWHSVLQVLIALTLIIGNTAALLQTNFKRLMAYSAIAHTGFLAMTFLGKPDLGGPALTYYLLIYTLSSAAVFAIIAALQRSERGFDISDMRGLFYRHPAYAVALAICLLSLAGLPPLAGFFGKLMAFQAAYQNGYVGLTLIAVLTSVASLVYYLRPAMLLFMPDRTPSREFEHGKRFWTTATVFASVVGVVLFGLLPNLWYHYLAAGSPMWWRLTGGF